MLSFEEGDYFVPDFSTVPSSWDKDESRFSRHDLEVRFGLRKRYERF